MSRNDVWQLVDAYMPAAGVVSKYHTSILIQRVGERLGSSGVAALVEALDRVEERLDQGKD